jgi:hypothetical protein
MTAALEVPLPPLGRETILATLTAMQQISIANNRPLEGYEVEYRTPQTFHVGRRLYTNVLRLRFHSFRLVQGGLYVHLSARAPFSYQLPGLRDIVRVLPAGVKREDRFATFDEFANRFDRRFIKDDALSALWSHGSSQHDGPFRPSDFRGIGPKGRKVVKEFLTLFQDLDTATAGYNADGVRSVCHNSGHEHTGRNISVSHLVKTGEISYNSERPGGGNGAYYVLVTPTTVLHIVGD